MINPDSSRTFRNARREAIVVLAVIALSLCWTVGYCYLYGYQHASDSWVVTAGLATPRTPNDFFHIAGVPDWVFVGILLPWLMCSAFTIGFCLGMKDDELGADAEEVHAHGA